MAGKFICANVWAVRFAGQDCQFFYALGANYRAFHQSGFVADCLFGFFLGVAGFVRRGILRFVLYLVWI